MTMQLPQPLKKAMFTHNQNLVRLIESAGKPAAEVTAASDALLISLAPVLAHDGSREDIFLTQLRALANDMRVLGYSGEQRSDIFEQNHIPPGCHDTVYLLLERAQTLQKTEAQEEACAALLLVFETMSVLMLIDPNNPPSQAIELAALGWSPGGWAEVVRLLKRVALALVHSVIFTHTQRGLLPRTL